MPPENNSNNLSKYFTWEFIKILILVGGIIGGFYEVKTEIRLVSGEFKHLSEKVEEFKSTMNKKFDYYDAELKELNNK